MVELSGGLQILAQTEQLELDFLPLRDLGCQTVELLPKASPHGGGIFHERSTLSSKLEFTPYCNIHHSGCLRIVRSRSGHATRWSTTLSSKVNLPHDPVIKNQLVSRPCHQKLSCLTTMSPRVNLVNAINLRAKCGTNLVTQYPKI